MDVGQTTISPNLLAIVQAIMTVLAQGMIAHIALQSSHPHRQGQNQHALYATAEPCVQPHTRPPTPLRRSVALLVGCLVYSALLTMAQRAILASVQALQMPPDTNAPEFITGVSELHRFSRTILATTLQALMPTPDFPLANMLGSVAPRPLVSPSICFASSTPPGINLDRLTEYLATHCDKTVPPIDGVVAVLAVALIILTESLLRFRVVATWVGNGTGLFAPLLHSARHGWRHFGVLTVHIWTLRLIIVTIQILFCTFPLLLAQRFILPAVAGYVPGLDWISPTLAVATLVGTATVHGLIVAFSTVYDARLLLAILTSEESSVL